MKQNKIAIIGAGKSGIACAKLALKFGYRVLLSEYSNKKIDIKKHKALTIECGQHSNKILECDFIIISPGIAQDIPIINKAIKKNIPIIGEIEFASWFTKADILAITGSNGKSTTSTMLHEILLKSGYCSLLGGNIGIPFSSNLIIEHQTGCQVHVLELSSFQIESLKEFKSKISCILNISEDHLDRYKNMDRYIEAKLNISNFSEQILFDNNDPILLHRLKKLKNITELNSKDSKFKISKNSIYNNKENKIMFSLNDTHFIGKHNLLNALNACTLASLYGVSDNQIISAMKKIKPLEHRLECILKFNSISFYNDSKSTNISSTIKALDSFNRNIILILGGLNKGSDFSELKSKLTNVKNIYCYGEAGQTIQETLKNDISVSFISDFSECVRAAINSAAQNENVLLSPACASFDQFNSFEERGKLFGKIVMEIANV